MKTTLVLASALGALTFAGGGPLAFAQSGAAADKFRAEAEAEVATAYTVVFDTSGSMKGARLDQAKQAFRWWLGSVQPGNVWSVLCFDPGKGRVVVPFTPSGQNAVADAIDRFEANGNTPIVATLLLAEKQIVERKAAKPYERHVLLLFTDGDENQHPGRNGAVLEIIRQLRGQNVEVIGVGYAGAGDYMARASSRYFSAGDEAGLKTGLAQVEVEVDPLTPVNVTPEELKKLSGPAPEPSRTAPPAATKGPPPAESPRSGDPAPTKAAPRRASGFRLGSLVMLLAMVSLSLPLIFVVLRKIRR